MAEADAVETEEVEEVEEVGTAALVRGVEGWP